MAHIADNILTALKEAVIAVFWTKKDMRKVLVRSQVPDNLIARQDWNDYKINIATPILDELNGTPNGIGPLRRLVDETLQYKDGKHLSWVTDADKRMRDAERALEHLRLLIKDHDSDLKQQRHEREKRQDHARHAKGAELFQKKLADLKARFLGYFQTPNRQERGYALEEILYELFDLFELSPRGPFRRIGEQIDGAFVFDREHYLLEAKWQKDPVNLADLRDLDGAVESSLDNTLGLFISLNGFSPDGLTAYLQGKRPRLVCMDGGDLIAVLEGRIDLTVLLQRKKDLAVEKRNIFVRVNEILGGTC